MCYGIGADPLRRHRLANFRQLRAFVPTGMNLAG
jgi:hypothetical protein